LTDEAIIGTLTHIKTSWNLWDQQKNKVYRYIYMMNGAGKKPKITIVELEKSAKELREEYLKLIKIIHALEKGHTMKYSDHHHTRSEHKKKLNKIKDVKTRNSRHVGTNYEEIESLNHKIHLLEDTMKKEEEYWNDNYSHLDGTKKAQLLHEAHEKIGPIQVKIKTIKAEIKKIKTKKRTIYKLIQ
jgi:hypothetical protein